MFKRRRKEPRLACPVKECKHTFRDMEALKGHLKTKHKDSYKDAGSGK